MRIIAGTKRGIRLASFKNGNIRPTTDSTKELIFNVLRDYVEDSTVLDIYSGTGSLGIEALSRGAAKAVFIDSDRNANRILQANLSKSGFEDSSEILCFSAKSGLRKLSRLELKFDLIFADPPYEGRLAQETIRWVEDLDLLSPAGWLTIEHAKSDLSGSETRYTLRSQKRQGETQLSFYQYEK